MEIRDQRGDLIVAEPLRVVNLQIQRPEARYVEDLLGNRVELPTPRSGVVHAELLGNENHLRALYPDVTIDDPAQIERYELLLRQSPLADSYNRFHNAFLQSINAVPNEVLNEFINIDASWVYQHEEATLNLPVELRPEAEEHMVQFEVHEQIGIGMHQPVDVRGIRANRVMLDEFHDLPANEFNVIVGRSRRPSISVERVNWRYEGF